MIRWLLSLFRRAPAPMPDPLRPPHVSRETARRVMALSIAKASMWR